MRLRNVSGGDGDGVGSVIRNITLYLIITGTPLLYTSFVLHYLVFIDCLSLLESHLLLVCRLPWHLLWGASKAWGHVSWLPCTENWLRYVDNQCKKKRYLTSQGSINRTCEIGIEQTVYGTFHIFNISSRQLVVINVRSKIAHIVMLQCTIRYEPSNGHTVSHDMGSVNSLSQWII